MNRRKFIVGGLALGLLPPVAKACIGDIGYYLPLDLEKLDSDVNKERLIKRILGDVPYSTDKQLDAFIRSPINSDGDQVVASVGINSLPNGALWCKQIDVIAEQTIPFGHSYQSNYTLPEKKIIYTRLMSAVLTKNAGPYLNFVYFRLRPPSRLYVIFTLVQKDGESFAFIHSLREELKVMHTCPWYRFIPPQQWHNSKAKENEYFTWFARLPKTKTKAKAQIQYLAQPGHLGCRFRIWQPRYGQPTLLTGIPPIIRRVSIYLENKLCFTLQPSRWTIPNSTWTVLLPKVPNGTSIRLVWEDTNGSVTYFTDKVFVTR